MTTKEIIEILKTKIIEAQLLLLPGEEILKVVSPAEIKSYTPKHPAGEYLVVYKGAQYGKSKSSGSVVQDKDVRISVYTIVKHSEKGKAPEDYTDFLESALSGIKLTVNRADKLVYPEKTDFIKEENKYWWYESVFVCPAVNIASCKNE